MPSMSGRQADLSPIEWGRMPLTPIVPLSGRKKKFADLRFQEVPRQAFVIIKVPYDRPSNFILTMFDQKPQNLFDFRMCQSYNLEVFSNSQVNSL